MAITEKDKILTPVWDSIPKYLKERPQWVLWKATLIKGEYKKVPYQVNGLSKASSNEPATWNTFENVRAAYEQGDFDGVGFAMATGDNLVCVDLDGINLERLPKKYAQMAKVSYTEVSPSGTGLHIWLLGEKPAYAKSKRDGIEFYDGSKGRYITVTGRRNFSIHEDVRDGQDLINHIAETYFQEEKEKSTAVQAKPRTQKKSPNLQNEGNSFGKLSDSDVLSKMFAARNGHTIQLLWNGDTSAHGDDESRADFALANHLAYWTNGDYAQTESLMWQSNLVRDKWEKHPTYLADTIKKAIDDLKVSNHSIPDSPKTIQGANTTTVEALPKPGNSTNPYDDVLSLLETDDKGKIIKTAFNVEQIFNSRIFHRKLGYDVFRQREVIAGDLPWRKRLFPHKNYEQWQSADDAQLRHFLRYHFNIGGKELVMDTLTHSFHKNSFHPVKIYIKTVPWDRQPRVETFFIDYLGADDTPYTRAVARKWFTAAVKRIYEPGCKFDYMPVLVGEQGVGKSTAIQKLAPEFFNDSLRNFDIKESGEILQSSWIVEIGELAAMKKSEEEEMKGFLSRQVDTYRPAYARTAQDFPRHCVFMGTTNNYQFLKDTTGNRRFLPIQVSDKRKFTPWDDLDEMAVAQLWAEAHAFYTAGESIDLEDEIKEVAKIVQAEYTESDVREGAIHDYLEMLLPTNWDNMSILDRRQFFQDGKQGSVQREFVCVMEIWKECLGEYDDPSRMDSNKIIGILNKLGWKPKAPSRKRFKHYSIQRAFTKQ